MALGLRFQGYAFLPEAIEPHSSHCFTHHLSAFNEPLNRRVCTGALSRPLGPQGPGGRVGIGE
jgi:hypothetical protein